MMINVRQSQDKRDLGLIVHFKPSIVEELKLSGNKNPHRYSTQDVV
jgi:hypothetical protein